MRRPRGDPLQRSRIAIGIFAILLVWLMIDVASGYLRYRGWTQVARFSDVIDRGAVYLPARGIFITADRSLPLVFSAERPGAQGHRVLYCAGAGGFTASRGERWDGMGRYLAGPAPRGLDSYPAAVRAGVVFTDLGDRKTGPPRSEAGTFTGTWPCNDEGRESEPGIAAPE